MQSAQHLIELCPQQLVNIIDIQFTGLKYCTTSDSAGFIGKIFIRQTQKILQNPAGSASQVSRFKTISPDTELFTRGCHLWHGSGGTYVGTSLAPSSPKNGNSGSGSAAQHLHPSASPPLL